MDEHYRRLGVSTVWLRHQTATGLTDDAAEFRRRLRQIESGAGELNLDSALVSVAAEIAALEEALDDHERIALILLITASLAALQEGSTRLPVTGQQARQPLGRILGALCGDAFGPDGAAAMSAAIHTLLASDAAPHVIGRNRNDYLPLLYLQPFIYHQRVHAAEARLGELLAERLPLQSDGNVDQARLDDALADILSRTGSAMVLSRQQCEAVRRAASHRLALISGGPGTGKTSIVVAIVRVLVRMGVTPEEIALAAPTGKAAVRMGESVNRGLALIQSPAEADRRLQDQCPEPATIHRLLGFSPSRGRFTYHRNNPLHASVVIVDEGSMLDLALMERLVDAIRPQAQLIVLGDADQLPSVAAGAVFRDLVAAAEVDRQSDRAICTRLTHSYRMDTKDEAGRAVFALAEAINGGDLSVVDQSGAKGAARLAERMRPADLRFEGTELLAGPVPPFLEQWYARRIQSDVIEQLSKEVFDWGSDGFDATACARIERIFDHMAASRVLCLTRVLSTGSERINASLHRRHADRTGMPPGREYLPGEPVIVVRNDYQRMLFNGDQGVILRVRRPASRPAAMAVFRRAGSLEAFHLAAMRESLELCYATTIHKAQGSEFDAVAIILPECDLPILTREALYTAVTRARRSVVIAGAPELARTGIARAIERFSGLKEELVRSLEERGADAPR